MTIRFAVLDDERIVATDLAYQLAQRQGWEVVGVYLDPNELRNCVIGAGVDVCFLDIETPGVDGLTLARELKLSEPDLLIVFVTAYHQYAASAYRVEALDYLVKPVTPASLDEACVRVETKLGAVTPAPADKFAVLSAGRIDYVPIKDVIAARAAGNYVALLTNQKEYLHRVTLVELAQTLAPSGFLRTHRSYLVCPKAIIAAKIRGDDIVEVTLSNGVSAPVSESYRRQVGDVLDASLLRRR